MVPDQNMKAVILQGSRASGHSTHLARFLRVLSLLMYYLLFRGRIVFNYFRPSGCLFLLAVSVAVAAA